MDLRVSGRAESMKHGFGRAKKNSPVESVAFFLEKR